MKTYTTVQGDMWDSIAYQKLGSESHTGELMAKNMQYAAYYTFPAGIVLELPEILTDELIDTLPPWRK